MDLQGVGVRKLFISFLIPHPKASKYYQYLTPLKCSRQAIMRTTKIFIVDKNPIHHSLIRYHLNVNRFPSIQTFPNGEECLHRIEKHSPPDFIITDYDVGNYTGFDFLRKIRETNPDIQVIYFSSHTDPVLALKLLEAGASDFIVKPSKLETGISELIKNLKYVLRETTG
jgi:CheY-like chemotaxis protein